MEQKISEANGNAFPPRRLCSALYIRLSADDKDQDSCDQRAQLRQFCEAQGWETAAVYEDYDSGGTGAHAQFRAMLRDAATKKWDLVVFWSLDRFTREGTLATLKSLALLESHGVYWRSYTEPWIQERARAGLKRARTSGTKSGKPIGRPRAVFDQAKAVEMRRAGLSWSKIARNLCTSVASVRRACNSLGTRP